MSRVDDYSRSNLVDDEDADTEHTPLTGCLTWGKRSMGADGQMIPSEQEEMFWTSLRGVNDNEAS